MYSSSNVLSLAAENTNYHNVLIRDRDFRITHFLSRSFALEYASIKVLNNFTVTTDVHGQSRPMGAGNDTQLHVMCGDYSGDGFQSEIAKTFQNFQNQTVIMATGNHDYNGQVDIQ